MSADEPVSARALEELAAGFRAGTLAVTAWTHAAHLCVAAWHVDRFGAAEALSRLRTGILRLNQQHGTPNTATRGYHESITVAYVRLIADFLARCPPGAPLATCTTQLLASPLAAKDALLRHWTREVLFSPLARAQWVPPDWQPLP